ncbi:hypothetical protein EMIT0158MI4_50058 [Burkholderia ambifaria]
MPHVPCRLRGRIPVVRSRADARRGAAEQIRIVEQHRVDPELGVVGHGYRGAARLPRRSGSRRRTAARAAARLSARGTRDEHRVPEPAALSAQDAAFRRSPGRVFRQVKEGFNRAPFLHRRPAPSANPRPAAQPRQPGHGRPHRRPRTVRAHLLRRCISVVNRSWQPAVEDYTNP